MSNISVCIITYQEQDYIKQTLDFLQLQSIKPEIVIADYDPNNTRLTENAVKDYDVNFVKVKMKGIGLARRIAVEHASGDYILNFDADSFFDRTDALQLMVEPLENKEVASTHCRVFQDSGGVVFNKDRPQPLMSELYRLRNVLSFFTPLLAYDHSLMFSRVAYDQTSGFPADARYAESVQFMAELFYLFGKKSYRFLDTPIVYTSPRRGFKLDYDLAIRGNKTLKV